MKLSKEKMLFLKKNIFYETCKYINRKFKIRNDSNTCENNDNIKLEICIEKIKYVKKGAVGKINKYIYIKVKYVLNINIIN